MFLIEKGQSLAQGKIGLPFRSALLGLFADSLKNRINEILIDAWRVGLIVNQIQLKKHH